MIVSDVERYLIAVHIGPVQGFIASARRSQDLWFGSYVLSELSREVAKSLKDSFAQLVFPHPDRLEEADIANKILGVIETSSLETFTGEIRNRLNTRLEALYTQAFKKVVGGFDDKVAELQIKDLIEFYWAAVLYPKGAEYNQARRRVEAILESRKTTRDFVARPWAVNEDTQGKYPQKSSLDGQRESVIPEFQPDSTHTFELSPEELFRKYRVRPGERLCGVSLLKRYGAWDNADAPSVFSTSHMAAMPLLERMDELEEQTPGSLSAAGAQFTEYVKWLTQRGVSIETHRGDPHAVIGQNDARILYESRFAEYMSESNAKKARQELRYLLDLVGVSVPNPYYALLMADGDRMGKAFDRAGSFKRDDGEGHETHAKLSKALANFALEVREVVKKHKGCLVYAGADDVLTYLPLHKALECATALAQCFDKHIGDFERESELTFKPEDRPTLSAGMVIAHHLEPLSDVLEWVRGTEKAAKNTYGRNALAITLAKRGGVNSLIGGKWGQFDLELQAAIGVFRQGKLSSRAAYDLLGLSQRLEVAPLSDTDREMLKIEAARMVARKKVGEQEVDKATQKQIEDLIQQEMDQADSQNKKSDYPLQNVAKLLIVAREIARVQDQADPNKSVEVGA